MEINDLREFGYEHAVRLSETPAEPRPARLG
jgi:hypothetical protein